MYFEVFWQVTPVKFLKNGYPFWCILSHFHKPLPDFFLKLTSILMHFEVFWQVTPGKFLTNGYPLWCILRYFFRRQPWNFFLHLHPFWCILKYFRTSSLENLKKIDIHFGAFFAIFTSHSRNFLLLKNWHPFWCILRYFDKSYPEKFWNAYVFSYVTLGKYLKNRYPFCWVLTYFHNNYSISWRASFIRGFSKRL